MAKRQTRRWKGALLVLALTAVVAVLLLSGEPAPRTAAGGPDLQDGDFLVGVTVDQPFGGAEGRIVRVRDGQATVFCAPVTGNAGLPGYWNTPSDVLIDSQGRVVFLAYLHGNDPVPYRGFGLWRCDAMGATPTLLGAFGSDANPLLINYPRPLGSRDVRFVGGLHLKRSKGLDLNSLTMAEAQFYVFAVSDISGDSGHADTIAYNVATGAWIESFEDPVPTELYGGNTNQIDMINANGYTFSVAGGSMRAFAEPIGLEFQIGEFTGGLAFQSLHDLSGAAVDDSLTPNSPSCDPHPDNVPLNRPTAADGNIYPMNILFQLAWGDGLILHNNYGGGGWGFLPDVSLVLFDLIPENDVAAMYHEGLGCSHQKKLDFTAWHYTLSDSDGTPRGVTRMTPNGTAGTQGYPYYRVVGVGPSQEVVILAEGLNNPVGIDVYPGFTPPLTGVALFFKIDSPVDVLITAPDGRRIGVDPGTGLPVNDYGDAGYDSNTNEPHIYGFRDPVAGDYTISARGTGAGPFTITTYGANLGTEVITRAIFTGDATPGSSSLHTAGVTSDGAVTNGDPVTPTPTPADTATPTETSVPTDTPTSTPTATSCPDNDGDTLCDGVDLDDDNDGCTDAQELGPNGALGGRRDPNNFWDFFDTPDPAGARDAIISTGDLFRIVLRFGSTQLPPPTKSEALAEALTPPAAPAYHTAFDRSPPTGDPWDLGPPDSTIATNDILFEVNQFGHTCA